MGLSGKSKQEIEFMKQTASILLTQVNESLALIDKTVNPNIFFGRYDFLLATLAKLSDMEKYITFQGEQPSALLKQLSNPSVRDDLTNAFIKRTLHVTKLHIVIINAYALAKWNIIIINAYLFAEGEPLCQLLIFKTDK